MRLPPVEKAQLYARDGYRCWLCGKFTKKKKMPPQRRRSLDHVVPRLLKGPNSKDNLITCCRQCNMYRSAARITLDNEFRNSHLRRNERSESLARVRYSFMEALTAYRELAFAAGLCGQVVDRFHGIEDEDLSIDELKFATAGLLKQINNLQKGFGEPGSHFEVIRGHLRKINEGVEWQNAKAN